MNKHISSNTIHVSTTVKFSGPCMSRRWVSRPPPYIALLDPQILDYLVDFFAHIITRRNRIKVNDPNRAAWAEYF
jgi:hypothetical protein